MPLDLERFARTRPYLYHLTAASNIPWITADRRLDSAFALLERSGRADQARVRRKSHLVVHAPGREVVLRDQAPLHRGNLRLPEGFTFEDFVAVLNARVFFWPGNEAGPIDYGVRHFERYSHEDCAVIVVRTKELFDANLGTVPQFCRYNSGSPRCNGGHPVPRGPNTFVPADLCSWRPGEIKEVTFSPAVLLDGCGLKIVSPARWTVGSTQPCQTS